MSDNKIIEFMEFNRLREDRKHANHWESQYRSQTKEMLLNQLLEEQENNYASMQKSPKDNQQFHALLKVLEEKSSTSWLKQVIQGLRQNAVEAYRKISEPTN